MNALEPVTRQLDALRNEGAWRLDPVRFRYIESLARRLPGQPAAVCALLQDRLRQAVDDYAKRFEQSRGVAAAARPARRPPAGSKATQATPAAGASCPALAQLNDYIREASHALRGPGLAGEPLGQPELASVRRFRHALGLQRTQDQVARAVTRKPANAGPLNSHALALQSLALMQSISPDYLRRFVLQVETLQWLERAGQQYPAAHAKGGKPAKAPARRGRTRK